MTALKPGMTVLVIIVAICSAQSKLEGANSYEVTQTDVFSMSGWNSLQITVDGFRLGMSRAEALKLAARKNLRFLDPVLPDKACEGKSCDVVTIAGPPRGFGLSFDAQGRINDIGVTSPLPSPYPHFVREFIANYFHGKSRELFFHYTDNLRVALLGLPDQKVETLETKALDYIYYRYSQIGVAFHTVHVWRLGMKSPVPELDSIDFFTPSASVATKH